jgi:hypothetical protein
VREHLLFMANTFHLLRSGAAVDTHSVPTVTLAKRLSQVLPTSIRFTESLAGVDRPPLPSPSLSFHPGNPPTYETHDPNCHARK